jgi:DnaJ-class molecular chaperone
MAKNYYDLLGVSRDADEKQIRMAYRRLARKYHPDVNSSQDDAAERFKEVNEANEVLSNAESRKLYDRYGDNWQKVQQHGPGAATSRRRGPVGGDPFGGMFGGADVGSMFGNLFSGGGRRGGGRQRQQRPAPLEQPVEITLDEAFKGTTRALQVTGQTVCTRCDGAGIVDGAACPECLSQGFSYQPVRGEVAIPAGVDNGSRVRVIPGGQQVVLTVQVQPHPKFQRKGADLYTEVSVPLYDVVLGTEVVVPTLTGQVALTLPPESQNGRVFRLGRQGMPKLGAPSERGTLYVTIKSELPTSLTDEERKLFEQLQGLRKDTGGQDDE